MTRKTNAVIGATLFGGMVLSLASCTNWNYSSIDIENATPLDATVQIDRSLTISLSSSENIFLPNIQQESVTVVNKADIKSKEGATAFTMADIQNAKLKDFSILQKDQNNLVITLSSFVTTTYYVFVNKDATTNGKLAMGVAKMVSDSYTCIPFFSLDSEVAYGGEADPSFAISYSGVEVADTSKVSFGGAFRSLGIGQINNENNVLSIRTSGTVDKDAYGTVVLSAGFFQNIDTDISLYRSLTQTPVYVDQASFKYEGNTLSFDLKASEGEFNNQIDSNSLSFDASYDKASIKNASYKDSSTISAAIVLDDTSINDVNDALQYLDAPSLLLQKCLKGSNCAISVTLFANFPSLITLPTFNPNDNSFELNVLVHDGTLDEDVSENDVAIDKTNLIFDGDSANATLKSFDKTAQGFHLLYDAQAKNFDDAYGEITIDSSKLSTKWGAPYAASRFFKGHDIATPYALSKNLDEFESDILNLNFAKEDITSGKMFDSLLTKLDVDKGNQNLGIALSSLLWMFDMYDILEVEENKSLENMGANFFAIEEQVRNFEYRLGEYSETLENQEAAKSLGVDKTEFERQYAKWVSFNDLLDTLEHHLANYKASVQNALEEMIRDGDDDYSTQVYLAADKDGNLYAGIPDPEDDDLTIDGDEIESMHLVDIPRSYFASCRDLYQTTGQFDVAFCDQLKYSLSQYLVDQPQQGLDADNLFIALIGNMQIDVLSPETMDGMVDSLAL